MSDHSAGDSADNIVPFGKYRGQPVAVMLRASPLPIVELLHSLFSYSPESGELRWRPRPASHFISPRIWARWNARYAGKIAGSSNGSYRQVLVGGAPYVSHKVIWALMTGDDPPVEIDHCNGDGEDNRWLNLRLATRLQQTWNAGLRKDRLVGLRSTKRCDKRWQARIAVRGITRQLGSYGTVEEAHAAYCRAARAAHGEFYRPSPAEVSHSGIAVRTLAEILAARPTGKASE